MRIPRRFWVASFDGIQDDGVRGATQAYIKDLDGFLDRGEGILFWGPNGTGKTCAAVVIAKEARRLGASVLFITAESLRQASLDKEKFDGDLLVTDRAMQVDLLVLDELGKEHSDKRSGSGWSERLIENLLRVRASNCKSTVITTNANRGDMEGRYSTSMMEVLKETCFPVQMEGESLRDQASTLLRTRLAAG
jgi:DNA replication protein DnaC